MISFSNFNRDLGIEQRKLFKQYEKVSYKLINTTHAMKFNNVLMVKGCVPQHEDDKLEESREGKGIEDKEDKILTRDLENSIVCATKLLRELEQVMRGET